MVKTTAPGNVIHKFSYDDKHNIVGIAYPDGRKTQIEYDPEKDWVTAQKGPGRKATSYAYKIVKKEPLDQVSMVTDFLGHRTLYHYKESDTGIGLAIKDGMGGITIKLYDASGNLVSTKDPNGRSTPYAYDKQSRLVRVVDKAGNKMEFSYSGACGKSDLASITDVNGNIVTYGRDSGTGMSYVVDALGGKVQLGFDSHGMMVRRVGQLGGETAFQRDRFGNLIGIRDAQGRATTMAYDPLGRVTTVEGPEGAITRFRTILRANCPRLPLRTGERFSANTTWQAEQSPLVTRKAPDATPTTKRATWPV